MKTESPAPLVSNEDLGSNMNVYEASLEKHTSHDVVTRLNMTTAYGAGARNMRDIYEPALSNMRAERDELVVALDRAQCLLSAVDGALSESLLIKAYGPFHLNVKNTAKDAMDILSKYKTE